MMLASCRRPLGASVASVTSLLESWRRALVATVVAPVALGCQPYRACDDVDEAAVGNVPDRLSLTGLYASGSGAPASSDALAPGVRSFRPRFELWSDGASKRRWIWMPPGARIETSNMDDWQFPIGTKLWKEFTRDGVRVETRLLQRLQEGWVGLAYLWKADGSDAFAAPYGAIDALGTSHDVPASNECNACHGGRTSHVLGFSAVQLAHQADPGSLDLDELIRADLIASAPAVTPHVPGNDSEQAALGYLHANCSHCHNAPRPKRRGARCFDPENDLDLLLPAEAPAAPSDTPTYRTAKDFIEPGRPNDSSLLELVNRRGRFSQMPPLATESVDTAGVALLRRWIEEM